MASFWYSHGIYLIYKPLVKNEQIAPRKRKEHGRSKHKIQCYTQNPRGQGLIIKKSNNRDEGKG